VAVEAVEEKRGGWASGQESGVCMASVPDHMPSASGRRPRHAKYTDIVGSSIDIPWMCGIVHQRPLQPSGKFLRSPF